MRDHRMTASNKIKLNEKFNALIHENHKKLLKNH